MYYNKRLQTYTPASYTFSLSDFSRGINREIDENLLSMNYAKSAYNVSLEDKSLRSGHGIDELELPHILFDDETIVYELPENTDSLALWALRVADTKDTVKDLLIVYCSDKKLYYTLYFDAMEDFVEAEVTMDAEPVILTYMYNGRETAVICSPKDTMYIWNGTPTPVDSEKALHLSSMCSHYERIFASSSDNKNEIRFSQDFDITNWEESSEAGGFIQLVDERGYINKLISFNDYVYIIRDYGISRLSAYGDQSEFSVTHINLTSNRIYGNTAVLCGDRIIMLTSSGLYYCAGSSLYKYDFPINSLINKDMMEYAKACYYDGKYYLATRIDFDDDQQIGCESETDFRNNVLIEFDLETQKFNITRGVDICSIAPAYHENTQHLLFLFHGNKKNMIGELTNDGLLFGQSLAKSWRSPLSDLGSPNRKIVKSINLVTESEVTIILRTDEEEQTLQVLPSDKAQIIQCNVVGTRISIEFSTDGQLHISNPTITVDFLEN